MGRIPARPLNRDLRTEWTGLVGLATHNSQTPNYVFISYITIKQLGQQSAQILFDNSQDSKSAGVPRKGLVPKLIFKNSAVAIRCPWITNEAVWELMNEALVLMIYNKFCLLNLV